MKNQRGIVFSQGIVRRGATALVPLALEGINIRQIKAVQAITKLTITSKPETTIPAK